MCTFDDIIIKGVNPGRRPVLVAVAVDWDEPSLILSFCVLLS